MRAQASAQKIKRSRVITIRPFWLFNRTKARSYKAGRCCYTSAALRLEPAAGASVVRKHATRASCIARTP